VTELKMDDGKAFNCCSTMLAAAGNWKLRHTQVTGLGGDLTTVWNAQFECNALGKHQPDCSTVQYALSGQMAAPEDNVAASEWRDPHRYP
jgi:hypothetical protein